MAYKALWIISQRRWLHHWQKGRNDGKGRIMKWLQAQHRHNKAQAFYNMTMTIFTTGTYIEMAISGGNLMAPQVVTQKSLDDSKPCSN
ncbi:hypothetical protein FOXG_21066 [Fusarium oxysporum f. sp. lycopersici 4287]|uniref:Uncharacterized protein n=2 Tax=Fusarium oxysporum TaxID=5507 RepID=A0A0J9VT38_FUSO4|nr:hypothetical protein FOXG_21066 [Fusarium oxysporum f. sp. lycopersici 4287]EXK36696.1 hypothetical protein FOMG_09864 [Fusarium oxysporum f. sp. melonis 26406]KNB14159.1 hypothetical protein FOXG_21066 [Fusarium oxysporum f. sp. lycopersici 4287]